MFTVHPPASPRSSQLNYPGPRPTKIISPKYVFNFSNSPNYSEITNSLANGLPCSSVDPQLYPMLTQQIAMCRRQLQATNNYYALQALNAAEDYIEEYTLSQARAVAVGQPVRTVRKQTFTTRSFSSNEVDQNVDLALSGQYEAMDEHCCGRVIIKLNQMLKEAIKNREYKKADDIQRTIHVCHSLEDNNRYQVILSSRVTDREDKSLTAHQNTNRILRESIAEIEQMKQNRDEELNELREAGKRDLAEFDTQYYSEIPPKFQKYTPATLALRHKLEAMFTAHRYQEAKVLRQELDEIEAKERVIWAEKYKTSLDSARASRVKIISDAITAAETRLNKEIEKKQRQSKEDVSRSRKLARRLEGEYEQAEEIQEVASARLGSPRTRERNGNTSRRRPQTMKTQRSELPQLKSEFRQKQMINQIIYTRTYARPGTAAPTE